MSSVGNAGEDDRETSQERHPVDLAAKTTLKTTVDSARPVSVSKKVIEVCLEVFTATKRH
jgi:hypothetical protein